jgi:hypothetical protein
LSDAPEPPGFTPTPRPASVRIAALAAIVLLAVGFPILLLVYAVAGDDTRDFVGSLMSVMVGATVIAWFYTRSRTRPPEDPEL